MHSNKIRDLIIYAMRILFIVYLFPKLSETFILNQITGLLDRGHDVEIIAQLNPKEKKAHPDLGKYSLMERVHYLNMPQKKSMRLIRAAYLLTTNLHKNPKKILDSLNILRHGRNALSLRLLYACIFSLNNRVLQGKFDVIHCHHGPNGVIGAYLRENGFNGMLVTGFYGYDVSGYIKINGGGVYNYLFERGDVFLPISNHMKKKLIALNCDEKKIIIHHLGIDPRKFKYVDRKKSGKGNIIILTVGRLVEKKGHEHALKAIARLSHNYKNIKYIIAGDGPLRGELESMSSDLGIRDKVQFYGAVEQDEAVKLYEDAHIFILPSVTARNGDQEGTPVVLMEAQAAGLPVVSTLHSGIPEVVRDGVSGFLVPEKDVDALAEKLSYLIGNPGAWPSMGRAGLKFIEENYDVGKLNGELIKIFEEKMKDKK